MKFGNDSATFSEKEPWGDQFGLFRFSAGIGIYASDYSAMSAEVKTSMGTISGQVGLPGPVDTIIADVGDSLNPGEPLNITWTDSEADFYVVHYMYIYLDSLGDLKALTVYKFLENNSLSFDSTSFIYNGEVNIRSVKPVNGPFPDSHSVGNMNGGGTGYLYYTNSLGQSRSKSIKVGSGWSAGAGAPPLKINRDIKSERNNVRDLLFQRLNFSLK